MCIYSQNAARTTRGAKTPAHIYDALSSFHAVQIRILEKRLAQVEMRAGSSSPLSSLSHRQVTNDRLHVFADLTIHTCLNTSLRKAVLKSFNGIPAFFVPMAFVSLQDNTKQ